jgi:hypothetical protein
MANLAELKKERLTRKQLPDFGVLEGMRVDIDKLLAFLYEKNYLDPEMYKDGQFSHSEKIGLKDFLVANEYCKNTFFKEAMAESMEGTMYRQLYLTTMDPSKRSGNVQLQNTTAHSRQRRLNRDRSEYLPEADEYNLGFPTDRIEGPIKDALSLFKAPLARVRFAMIAPHFKVKPHSDYDPSYIVRYHIPLVTNPKCILGIVYADGTTRAEHLPADGRVYFFNAGRKHWVQNDSDEWRLHLIVDVQNQDDLANLTPI